MSFELFGVFLLVLVGEMVGGNAELTYANYNFSQRLYQQIAVDKENVVYSPLSNLLALTLSWYGASGTTQREMAEALGYDKEFDMSDSFRMQLRNVFTVIYEEYLDTVYLSNALYLNPKFPIEPDFIREAQESYHILVDKFNLDAPGGPETPINNHVSEATKGVIKDILPAGTIDDNTPLVIVNTLYFEGIWLRPFDKNQTSKQDFYKLDGVTSQVDMMRDTRDMYHKQDNKNGVDIVMLDFRSMMFSLYIVLPQEVDGIRRLENVIQSPGVIHKFCKDLELTRVTLSVPKFKIETSLSLRDPLEELGMVYAFNASLADFTGISPSGVYISDVFHKSVLEIQETGTVANETREHTRSSIFDNDPQKRVSFTADHPFLFFLRDDVTFKVLLLGKFSG